MHQPDTHAAPSFVDGLKAVRHLHYRVITETGLTTADELLYPASLPYVEDLISYHAIGARSVEDFVGAWMQVVRIFQTTIMKIC